MDFVREIGPYKLSILMPVFNEAATIKEALQVVLAAPFVKEVIVVDDGSTDQTATILRSFHHEELKVIFLNINQGKGGALKTAFSHATGDVLLIQDADLEYDPSDYASLLNPILQGKADVVFGTRFSAHGEHRLLYFWHYVGNRLLTLLSNIFTNLNQSDMECGYKVFTRETLKGISINERRFGFEPEIVAKMAKKKLRIYEVPVSYFGRTYEQGKKIGWKDGVWAAWCIVRYNLLH